MYGLAQRTRERIKKRDSHVDWWLYKDATPYKAFELIPDFEMYLLEYNRIKHMNKCSYERMIK